MVSKKGRDTWPNWDERLVLLVQCPEMLDAFVDMSRLMYKSRAKHGDTWLNEDGPTMSLKDNCASLGRHLEKKKKGVLLDEESGYDHDLHLMLRSAMSYVRKKRGLVHPKDKESNWTLDDSNCLTVEENIEKNKGGQYMKPEGEDKHQL